MTRRAIVLSGWLLLIGAATATAQTDAALDDYHFANGLYGEKLHELAAKEYERFLEQHSGHEKVPDVLLRLGDCYFELGDHRRAIAPLDRLRRKHPRFADLPEGLYRLGRCLLEAGQIDDALARFTEIEENHGRHELAPAARYWRGETLFRAERHAEAAEVLTQFVRQHADSPYRSFAQFTLGWAAYRSGRPEDAVAAFRAVIQDRARTELHDEARYLTAESLYQLARFEDAGREYARVPAESSYGEPAASGAAWCLAQLERHGDAAQAFAQLVQSHPDSERAPDHRLQAGICAYRAEDYASALRLLDAGSGELPRAEASYWRGQANLKIGQPKAALTEFERVGRERPEPELAARAGIGAGDALFELDRFEDAARQYDAAASGAPTDELKSYALHAASLCFQRLGRAEEAVARADRLLENGASGSWQVEAGFARAEGLFDAGRFEEAATTYERVAAEAPDPQRKRAALYKLGWSHYRREAWPEARAALLQAAEAFGKGGESDECRYLAARCLLQTGAAEDALEELSRLGRRGGDYADEARLERARLLDQAGRTDEALAEYDETLRAGGGKETLALALYERAGLTARLGRFDEARKAYALVLEQFSDMEELAALSRHGLGWALLEAGDAEGALKAVRPILQQGDARPDLVEGSLRLTGAAHRKLGRPDRAIEAFRELAKQFPKTRSAVEAQFGIGVCQAASDEHRQAARTLEKLLRSEPPNDLLDKVLYELAMSYDALSDHKRALATRQKLVASCATSPLVSETLFRMGEASYGSDDFGAAAELYLKVADASGGGLQEKALYKLGWSRRQAGDQTAAAKAFLDLANRFPESDLAGEALFLAGESLMKTGALEEAVLPFDALVERFPSHDLAARALFQSGQCEARRERWDSALQRVNRHAKRYADSEHAFEVSFWIGRCHEGRGRFPSAIQSYQRVTELSDGPTSAEAQVRIGECYVQQKDLDRAIAEFLKVKFLYGHVEWIAEASLRAADCFLQKEQPERARKLLQDVIEQGPRDAAWVERARALLARLNER